VVGSLATLIAHQLPLADSFIFNPSFLILPDLLNSNTPISFPWLLKTDSVPIRGDGYKPSLTQSQRRDVAQRVLVGLVVVMRRGT
jgi:hypothetical protein